MRGAYSRKIEVMEQAVATYYGGNGMGHEDRDPDEGEAAQVRNRLGGR